ncbi:MAG: FadR/GntR family transcriptional regulator [Rectinema sp.]
MNNHIEPIKRMRLSEEILKKLKSMIMDGTLKAGEQLPPERELAELFNVSRASIREALRVLETLGFLEVKVGVTGGTYVKKISIEGLIDPFAEILGSEKELILEMLEFRGILETEIARKAAVRRTDEDLERLEKSISIMSEELGRGDIGLEGDTAFHEALAIASHNRVFQQTLALAKGLLRKTRQTSLSLKNQPVESLKAHKAILRAVRNGDAELAVKYMTKHLEKAQENAKLLNFK